MYYSRVFKPHSGPERKCSLPVSVTGYQPLIHYLTSWSRATQSNWDAAWTGEGWVGLHRLVWGLQRFMPLLSKLVFAFLPFQMEEGMDGQMDRVAFYLCFWTGHNNQPMCCRAIRVACSPDDGNNDPISDSDDNDDAAAAAASYNEKHWWR